MFNIQASAQICRDMQAVVCRSSFRTLNNWSKFPTPSMFMIKFLTRKIWIFFHCRYDREDNTFRFLVDVQFVTAMGPPGGGRNPVTPRYMRHFNVLAILDFDNSSLNIVFTIIVDWWMRKAKLPHDVRMLRIFLFKFAYILTLNLRFACTVKF